MKKGKSFKLYEERKRHFILSGSDLYYHSVKENSHSQNILPLQGCQVDKYEDNAMEKGYEVEDAYSL